MVLMSNFLQREYITNLIVWKSDGQNWESRRVIREVHGRSNLPPPPQATSSGPISAAQRWFSVIRGKPPSKEATRALPEKGVRVEVEVKCVLSKAVTRSKAMSWAWGLGLEDQNSGLQEEWATGLTTRSNRN